MPSRPLFPKWFAPRLTLLAASVIYLALLHVAYVYLTAPYWSYLGMYYSPISNDVVWWSWFAALIPVAWLPLRCTRPSLVVYYFLYAVVIVPTCTIPAYTAALRTDSLLELQAALLICFALLGLVYLIPLVRLPRIHLTHTEFFLVLLLFTCASYISIMHYVGLSFRFPNPLNVYDVRGEYAELAETVHSKWLGYCENWQSFVVNPFFMAYGLISKAYYITLLGLVGQLLIYALAGLKAVLFSLLLTIALLAVQRYKCFGLSFLWGCALFVGVCVIADKYVLNTPVGLTAVFVRRIVFMNGQLTGMWFEFFSNNRLALLGHSVLSGFTNYPYSLEPPALIGEMYFGHDRMNADANIWADGFANFSYFGMLGATVLLGAWLWLVDSSGDRRNTRLVMLMIGVPGFVLANCGLLTSLGNHGLGFTLLLIYLLPRNLTLKSKVAGAD